MTTPVATPGATPTEATPIADATPGLMTVPEPVQQAIGRVDARDKVLGMPIYAADRSGPDIAYAMTTPATIALGRITRIHTEAARAVPGVRLVLTHEDAPPVASPGFIGGGGFGHQSVQPLAGPDITYRGQTIGLVVADTLEAAIEAASLIVAEYEPRSPSVTLDAPGGETVRVEDVIPVPAYADMVLGDADAAFAASAVQIDATYDSPAQHQNPMEMIATVAEWKGDTLVIHEGTQNVAAYQNGVAAQLGIDPAAVEVVSPYIGGGFGQKGALQSHTALVAYAARQVGQPVKLVIPRDQLFHSASFRPASRHHIQLGGDRSGRILTGTHEVDQQTSRPDDFPLTYTSSTASQYPWEQYRGTMRLTRLDTQTPGFMRAPPEAPALFALESAVDEFAYAVGMDPITVRQANDTMMQTVAGLPLTSRFALDCLRRGAELFGWSGRSMAPGSMVADDGSLIGWGMALGSYPVLTMPGVARLRLSADGRVRVAVTGHEMGQGIRSAIAAQVAGTLSVPAGQIEIVVGETRGAVPQHNTAGSWGTATAIPAVRQALDDLLAEVARIDLDPGANRSPHAVLAAAGRDVIEVEGRHLAPGQEPDAFEKAAAGQNVMAGPIYPEFASFSYIAHFVEVRVEPSTHRVRVPRVVSVADCGRVMNRKTAESQVRGGVVWGIGQALRERSEVDPRYGGFLNAELAEYIVPVNADIGEITVDFIDEPDPLINRDGVKGLGEVVMAGVAPAIANAIFHATGRRHRSLPIRIEDML